MAAGADKTEQKQSRFFTQPAFLEHLMFKGTPSRNRRQLEMEVENTGTQLNAYTSREHTLYHTASFP